MPTEEPTAIQPIDNVHVMIAARDKFVRGEADLYALAVDLGVTVPELADAARRGNWLKARKELQRTINEATELAEQGFVMENRLPTAIDQLRLVKAASKKLESLLQTADNSVELRRLTESMASVINVAEKAVGLNMSKVVEEADGTAGAAKGKVPLVMIGIAPTVANQVEVKEVSVEG